MFGLYQTETTSVCIFGAEFTFDQVSKNSEDVYTINFNVGTYFKLTKFDHFELTFWIPNSVHMGFYAL